MNMEILLVPVVLLAGLAVFDIIVGVSNDAVNFLNSSIGARVAPRHVIMIVASLGILTGVTFSGGMMEVARKGIFHPQYFTMPNLMTIFLAVMLTDIILLDLFNTVGLPTSTTVSIVFELLGAAAAVAAVKIMQQHDSITALVQYINTGKAIIIIFSIFLSVIVAFVCGSLVQFISRLIFTFDYTKRLKRYGGLWGGIALSSITYFILVKGAKGATFITPDTLIWIKANTMIILLAIFTVSTIILQVLLMFGVNVLKSIVLIGTFALAMAFAANDLVNFIGVPMAGYHSYQIAATLNDPLTASMAALGKKVSSETGLLLLAGIIMVVTLWLSKKARTVTETEVSLGQQSDGIEKFESTFLSRIIVRGAVNIYETVKLIIPRPVQQVIAKRFDTIQYRAITTADNRPSFDLIRASVNLMVASAVISYATSQKLPLSTTYVSFMVAMGTSFADQAWGRESAVYRVTGVLTVIGGWFMTALMAFIISGACALLLFHTKLFGLPVLIFVVGLIIWKNKRKHTERVKISEKEEVFNLKKVTSVADTFINTLEHLRCLLREIRESIDRSLVALYNQNEYQLHAEKGKTKEIQRWVNIITANIFKAFRLLQKGDVNISYRYGQTIRRLQKLADGHRDIVTRAYEHVSNQHKGLLVEQIDELKKIQKILYEIILEAEQTFDSKKIETSPSILANTQKLRNLAGKFHQDQIERIRGDRSKTRLSILFYAIIGNSMMLAKQNIKLLDIFSESYSSAEQIDTFDLD